MTGSESLMRRKSSCKKWMRKYFSMMWSSNKYFNSQNDFYELFIDPNASLFTQVENSLFFSCATDDICRVWGVIERKVDIGREWSRGGVIGSCTVVNRRIFLAIIVSIHTTGGSRERVKIPIRSTQTDHQCEKLQVNSLFIIDVDGDLKLFFFFSCFSLWWSALFSFLFTHDTINWKFKTFVDQFSSSSQLLSHLSQKKCWNSVIIKFADV